MPITKNRRLAKILDLGGNVKTNLLDSDTIVTSGQKGIEINAGVNFTVSSVDTLPVSTSTGHTALDTSTNRLYIFNGSGWYHIATINNFSPQWITQPNGTYSLAIDGSTTTITVLASDSDDVPITYTAVTDSDFDSFATVSHDSEKHNVWTVTPTDSENGNSGGGTGTITFKASDGVNLVQAASTFTLSFKVTNSHLTELLLQADSTQSDAQTDTTSNHTITEVGDVTSTAFTPYHPGKYSVEFNSTDAYVEVPAAADPEYRLGNGTWTLEFWVKAIDFSLTQVLWIQRNQQHAMGSIVNINTSGLVQFYHGDGNNVAWEIQMSCGTITLGKWHHIAIVRNGNSSNNYKSYLDGTLVTTASFTGTPANRRIAGYIGGGKGTPQHTDNREFVGYLRDFRYTESAVYTGNFDVPTEPLTVLSDTKLLLFNGEPYIVDKCNVYGQPTVTSNVYVNRIGPYDTLGYNTTDHGGSLYYDGTGDYVTFPTSSNLNLGDSDFTIELWVHMTAYESGGFNTFIMPSESAGPDWQLDYKSGSSELRWLPYHSASPDTTTLNISGVTMNINVWYHIAVVRSGNFLSMYLNGKHLKTAAYNNTVDHNSNTTFYVGAREQGSSFDRRFTGYMTDLRIVKSSALYDSDIVVPTSPLTNVGGTGVLTFNNKNDIWDAAKGALLSKDGNVTASTTQTKFASTSSIYFDGSGDAIRIGDTSTFKFLHDKTVDYTIEGWIYSTSNSTRRVIFATGTSSSSSGVLLENNSGDFRYVVYTGSSGVFTLVDGPSISLNTWHHIAVTFDGTSIRIFKDGVLDTGNVTTWSLSGSTSNQQYIASIGRDSSAVIGDMSGYIQDFRITKRLARYTSDFTAPTSSLSG